MSVLPSLHPEPFGRTVVEAMALGVPVIAADDGGAAELVEDGYNGFRFAPRDVDALADRLATVLTDEVLRKGLRGNVRRCVKENFDAVEGGVRFTRAILDASA